KRNTVWGGACHFRRRFDRIVTTSLGVLVRRAGFHVAIVGGQRALTTVDGRALPARSEHAPGRCAAGQGARRTVDADHTFWRRRWRAGGVSPAFAACCNFTVPVDCWCGRG